MLGAETNNRFSIEDKYTATDIFYIEEMLESIEIGKNRLIDLFKKGYIACNEIKHELFCLVNTYESLKRKIQDYSCHIEHKYNSRLKEVRATVNKLLKQAGKLGITINVGCV